MPGPGIPTIKWGRFFDPGGVVHIAPAIEEYLMKGHRLALGCQCSPKIEKDKDYMIVIHYVIH